MGSQIGQGLEGETACTDNGPRASPACTDEQAILVSGTMRKVLGLLVLLGMARWILLDI